MDISLREDQKMLQKQVREFATKEVEPIALQIDEEERFPLESWKKLAKLGLTGCAIPAKYGGAGLDYVSYAIAIEEISRACPSTGGLLSSHNSLAAECLMIYANEEQKKKYLVPLAKGDQVGCFALTEPNAGSDASAIETTYKKEGDYYILNGTKIFITSGNVAGTLVTFATSDRSLGHKGISAFIVDKNFPGFSVGKVFKKAGMRGNTQAELVYNDCRVPKANLLGEEGKGFSVALGTIDMGRIGIAAQAVGISRAALEIATSYAKTRKQFGQTIGQFQAIQWMLVEMATKVDAARLLTYRAADLMDKHLPFSKEAAMAKLYASETAMSNTTTGMQILGGYGYMRDNLMQVHWRAAKLTEIYEGTSEVQRLVISRALLRG